MTFYVFEPFSVKLFLDFNDGTAGIQTTLCSYNYNDTVVKVAVVWLHLIQTLPFYTYIGRALHCICACSNAFGRYQIPWHEQTAHKLDHNKRFAKAEVWWIQFSLRNRYLGHKTDSRQVGIGWLPAPKRDRPTCC